MVNVEIKCDEIGLDITRETDLSVIGQILVILDQENPDSDIKSKFNGTSNIQTALEKTSPRNLNKKRKRTSKEVAKDVKSLTVSAKLTDCVDYHDLGSKREKILWLLYYAKRQNINLLSPTDFNFLAKKLDDRLDVKDFTANNRGNIRKGYVAKEAQGKIRILKDGIDAISNKKKED